MTLARRGSVWGTHDADAAHLLAPDPTHVDHVTAARGGERRQGLRPVRLPDDDDAAGARLGVEDEVGDAGRLEGVGDDREVGVEHVARAEGLDLLGDVDLPGDGHRAPAAAVLGDAGLGGGLTQVAHGPLGERAPVGDVADLAPDRVRDVRAHPLAGGHGDGSGQAHAGLLLSPGW